jgi:hypothetical protein
MLGLPNLSLARATVAALLARATEFERMLTRQGALTLADWLHTLETMRAPISGRPLHEAPSAEPMHPRLDRMVAAVLDAARAALAPTANAVPAATSTFDDERPFEGKGHVREHDAGGRDATAECLRAPASPRRFTSQPTRIARAAYLTNIWLELDWGQALYVSGLREGTWFAHALAHVTDLASPDDDPLCDAIGGVGPAQPLPEISPAKVEEACAAPLEACLRSIARRRIQGAELNLSVERWAGQRLLVVRGVRSGAPLGALLADTVERATTALRRVTSMAPADSVLRGSRALLELDRSGRVTPAVAPAAVQEGARGGSSLLLAAIAGTALELFAQRAGLSGGEALRSLVFAGRVVEDDELVLVELDASAIDVRLRVAGLDASPGWLPWRSKKLEFEFTGLETW